MSCPSCSSTSTEVVDSRPLTNGTRRRRYACLACRYRWTVWDGPRPQQRSPLSPEEVRIALSSSLSCAAMGRQLGCSKQAVSLIRRGQSHATLWPELPRKHRASPSQGTPTCLNCRMWNGGACSLGLPDPLEEGPGFASDCSLYDPRPRSPEPSPAAAPVTITTAT